MLVYCWNCSFLWQFRDDTALRCPSCREEVGLETINIDSLEAFERIRIEMVNNRISINREEIPITTYVPKPVAFENTDEDIQCYICLEQALGNYLKTSIF
jgi:hypothetical protein